MMTVHLKNVSANPNRTTKRKRLKEREEQRDREREEQRISRRERKRNKECAPVYDSFWSVEFSIHFVCFCLIRHLPIAVWSSFSISLSSIPIAFPSNMHHRRKIVWTLDLSTIPRSNIFYLYIHEEHTEAHMNTHILFSPTKSQSKSQSEWEKEGKKRFSNIFAHWFLTIQH